MIAEITTGISAAKNGIAILKGVKSVTDNAKIEVALTELRECIAQTQESLLAAQQSIHSLTEEKADLRKQLVEVAEWEAKKADYSLTEIRPGLLLYSYTQLDGESTPPHSICPSCFAKKHISILQKPKVGGYDVRCFNCEFCFDPDDGPQKGNVEVISGFRRSDRDMRGLL